MRALVRALVRTRRVPEGEQPLARRPGAGVGRDEARARCRSRSRGHSSPACAAQPVEHVVPGPEGAAARARRARRGHGAQGGPADGPARGVHAHVPRSSSAPSPRSTCRSARAASDGAQLFDTWDDYVSALGFPDYRLDVPRQTQTNALMVATFERLGVALCDRARRARPARRKGRAPPPSERSSSPSTCPEGAVDAPAFAPRFDVLHRTFLGYPASLAPPQRTPRFFQLYRDIVAGPRQGRPEVALLARRGRVGGRLLRPRAPPRVSPLLRSRPCSTSRRTFLKVLAAGAAAAFAGLPSLDAHGRRRGRDRRDRVLRLHHRPRRVGRDALGRPAQRAARDHPPRLDREHRHGAS